jgi:hypothetical protein
VAGLLQTASCVATRFWHARSPRGARIARPMRLFNARYSPDARSRSPRRPARQTTTRAPYRGPPVTLGHIRSHGVRRLLIYCSTGLCHHSAVVDSDRWPDETALLDLDRRAVCTKCGMIGADVRPNWSERPNPES